MRVSSCHRFVQPIGVFDRIEKTTCCRNFIALFSFRIGKKDSLYSPIKMNKYCALPLFFWIIFNRTPIASDLRKKIISFFLKLENTKSYLYFVRYPLTKCAACFVFWCNLPYALVFGEIIDVMIIFILTFPSEVLLIIQSLPLVVAFTVLNVSNITVE